MKDPWRLACAATLMAAMPAWGIEIKDAKFGYSISPPEFAGPRAGDVATRLTVFAPPEDGFSSNMGMMIQEAKISRDEFIARSKEQFEAAGITLRSSSKRDVSGRPAVLFEYDGQVRGRGLRFLQLAVILPERVLLLTYTATASAFAGLEAEFRRSLETFKLTPGSGSASPEHGPLDSAPGDPTDSYESTLCRIAQSIEALKSQYPQLSGFSASAQCNRERLTITYDYLTETAPRTGGWTSGVPSPTDDGVWLHIDFHDPDSTLQIHTQPVVPRDRFRDKRVMLLLREGARTKPLGAELIRILREHGVQPVDGQEGRAAPGSGGGKGAGSA